MKHRSGIIAAFASLTLLPLSAYAADATAPKADKPATDAKPEARPKAKQAPAICDATTASRIRRKPSPECGQKDPGARDISADELNNTGEMNINDALRKLDPRFQ